MKIGESARWHEGRLWLSNWGTQEAPGFVALVTPDGTYGSDPRPLRQPPSRTGPARVFATIVAVYLTLSLMWFAIDMLDDSTGLWFYWPMLGTGLVVVATGIGMFGLGGLFGADWERRQIDKYPERHERYSR